MPLLPNAQSRVSGAPGTGVVSLGAATEGSLSWAAAGAVDGALYSYRIEEGNAWEVGSGTYGASGSTLSRTEVRASSNSNAAVNFGAGAVVSQIILPADIPFDVAGGYAYLLRATFKIGTSADLGINAALSVYYSGSFNQFGAVFRPAADSTTSFVFQNASGNQIGSISQTGSSTAYNTACDGRIKPVDDRWPLEVGDLFDHFKPVRFKVYAGGEPEPGVGFIAQEVHALVPEAVTPGDSDPDGRIGDPDFRMWAVDFSKLVPFLVAEVQNQRRRLEALETELAALKGQPAPSA